MHWAAEEFVAAAVAAGRVADIAVDIVGMAAAGIETGSQVVEQQARPQQRVDKMDNLVEASHGPPC